ncbi:ATP-binding protein [Streptomyces mayteni]
MTAEFSAQPRVFVQHFAPTRRSVRLAHRLAIHQLGMWGHSPESPLCALAGAMVDELAAFAVFSGPGVGRGFQLRLRQPGLAGALRIEVRDARGDFRQPPWTRGRGLQLVVARAKVWGFTDQRGVGRTFWAELEEIE